MIVDVIEWALGVLNHPDTGVNAQLPNVPRPEEQDPPDPVAIYDEITSDWVRRGEFPADLLVDGAGNARTLLLVRLHPDPRGFAMHVLPEFEQDDPNLVPLLIAYARRKIEREAATDTIATQARDARQTIRTVARCFAQKFDSSHTAYVRNECTISLTKAGFVFNSEFAEPTADFELDSLVVPLRVIDRWALGLIP